MNLAIEIVPLARTAKEITRFIRISHLIYRSDPYWVAPLFAVQKAILGNSNPFFQHADIQLWVARRGGQDVGRIAGILDHNHNHGTKDSAAFFGFFECVDDSAVSHRLFDTVVDWAQQRDAQRLLGPMNPSTNDECGLLVEGFDASPVFMMTYNPRYYGALVEAEGLRKAKDLVAQLIDIDALPLERLSRIAGKARARIPNLRLRPVRLATLRADLVQIKRVYNAAWSNNWGFIPMTDAEVDFLAAQLKPMFMEGLTWLAEIGSEPIGLLLALPDYNLILKPLRGRLLTPKLLQLAPFWLGLKHPPLARVLTLGVTEPYRGKGIESALLVEALNVGIKKGFRKAEASWVLEDNVMMRRLLETVGGELYKTYRIYEKELR